MPLTTAVLNEQATHLAGQLVYASLHNADPGGSGANEHSGDGYARQLISWGSPSNGDITATPSWTTTPLEAVHSFGYWSAVSGGTFRGSRPNTGDAAANAAGAFNATLTEDVD